MEINLVFILLINGLTCFFVHYLWFFWIESKNQIFLIRQQNQRLEFICGNRVFRKQTGMSVLPNRWLL